MKYYQTDRYGIFTGSGDADPDPLDHGKYLIPAGAFIEAPPEPLDSGEVPVWFGGGWVLMLPQVARNGGQPVPATEEDINSERSNRVSAGTVVIVEGYGDVALQGRQEDQITLGNLAQISLLRIQQGDTTTLTKFRDRDNVDHNLTPTQVVDMWVKGTAWVSSVYEASWVLKDLDPIPLDYTDDKYWP